MKRPGSITFYFSLFISVVLLAACSVDAYDQGEGELSLMTAEMADVYTGNDGYVSQALTDEGERLHFDPPFRVRWMTKADTIYRTVLYYNKSNQRAISVGSVLLAVPRRAKEVKTDPVRFESLWMARTGRYLNAGIYLMTGATPGDSARQVLGAVVDTLMENADHSHTLHLILYHDQANVPEYYSQRTFVSIPIDSIQADSLSLRINTYSGEVVRSFPIKTEQ